MHRLCLLFSIVVPSLSLITVSGHPLSPVSSSIDQNIPGVSATDDTCLFCLESLHAASGSSAPGTHSAVYGDGSAAGRCIRSCRDAQSTIANAAARVSAHFAYARREKDEELKSGWEPVYRRVDGDRDDRDENSNNENVFVAGEVGLDGSLVIGAGSAAKNMGMGKRLVDDPWGVWSDESVGELAKSYSDVVERGCENLCTKLILVAEGSKIPCHDIGFCPVKQSKIGESGLGTAKWKPRGVHTGFFKNDDNNNNGNDNNDSNGNSNSDGNNRPFKGVVLHGAGMGAGDIQGFADALRQSSTHPGSAVFNVEILTGKFASLFLHIEDQARVLCSRLRSIDWIAIDERIKKYKYNDNNDNDDDDDDVGNENIDNGITVVAFGQAALVFRVMLSPIGGGGCPDMPYISKFIAVGAPNLGIDVKKTKLPKEVRELRPRSEDEWAFTFAQFNQGSQSPLIRALELAPGAMTRIGNVTAIVSDTSSAFSSSKESMATIPGVVRYDPENTVKILCDPRGQWDPDRECMKLIKFILEQ